MREHPLISVYGHFLFIIYIYIHISWRGYSEFFLSCPFINAKEYKKIIKNVFIHTKAP